MERGSCEFIYGAPTTFQGYGIEKNRIEKFVSFKFLQLSELLTAGVLLFAKFASLLKQKGNPSINQSVAYSVRTLPFDSLLVK